MRFLVALLAMSVGVFAQTNQLTPKEIADGWLLLFDGESTFGWTVEGAAKWRVAEGSIVADSGGYGWLRTNTQFGDYSLKVEFQTAADGNSGVFLRSAKGKDPHVTGYELQIFDAHLKFPTGSILDAARTNKKVKIAPGKWHSYEVFHIGARCLVKLDGKKVLDLNDTKSASGHLGLQFNPNKPVAFRNIKVRPLGLAPLFNDRNLSGWQEVQPAKAPAEPAVWSVKRGLLHVEKGPGQLETKTLYDDFILQLDVRTNSREPNFHPNSGVFFRGTPGGYWTGYEIQIRNEFKDGDRTKPVDTGSGGIYFHQPARSVVGTDNEFYTKTIVAQGRHIATWVNGYPVASWDDPYPEGTSPRNKQALLKAGPISLQAHDPKTNLDFQNIRIKSLKR
jgi:hypothetical protein